MMPRSFPLRASSLWTTRWPSIEVTRSYPIINLTGGTANTAGSSSITYSNVGTILQVTPRISANDFIWLKVVPIVSSHFGNVIVTVGGGNGAINHLSRPGI